MAALKDFMISKVRVKLISTFLASPEEMYYIRQLTRMIDEEINAVRRELLHMKSHGMVREEKRGNRLYYTFNRSYLFHKELMGMVAKSTGLGQIIHKSAPKLGKVKFAMISGRFARKMPRLKDTVDLLLVGDLIMPQVTDLIKSQEARLEREINYTVMTTDELAYRKSHSDPFIHRILEGSRVMIIGDEEDLVA
jgi:hypothetical protein